MTVVEFHPRSDSGLAQPFNNDGHTLRPKLKLPCKYAAVHYQGVPPYFYPKTDADVVKHVKRVQEVAFASGKSYEYSYLIPPRVDVAQVWEYAGMYQCAGSAGENDIAFSIQFCNGVGQPLTTMQIEAFRWLIATLIMDGALSTDIVPTKHRLMPGAATICPGFAIEDDWGKLLIPWIPEDTTPNNWKDCNMIVNFGTEGKPGWAACESTGPHTRWLKNGNTYAAIKSVGAPIITLPDETQQLAYLSTTRTVGEPPNVLSDRVRREWIARQNAA